MQFHLKKNPKISLVTPSFNQGQFLSATIDSILSQNYPNLEYIIIDGGSTDESLSIIKKHEKYLHFWCSEPDAGQYDAINKGFSQSTGEIMSWLNSDDMYYPWTLKTVASIFSELPQIEWLTTLQPGHWDWHGLCSGFSNRLGYSQAAFLDGCYLPTGSTKTTIGSIQQESTFWRRSIWDKVGGYISTEFKLAGDFDLWSRFYLHTELYGTISPLGGFRYQLNQKSRQRDKYILEAQKSLEKMRGLCQWKPNPSRKIISQLKLQEIPKVRKLFLPMCSYYGKRVVRKKKESPDGFWKIEKQRFFDQNQ